VPPLIAVTTSLTLEGRDRAQLNASYIRAVEGAGGVPILIPPQLSLATIQALIATVHGLVLTGGGDLNPARYGENNTASTNISDDRDTAEEAALNLALDRGIPILAICRGMQVLNVALGGTLVQDIATEIGTIVVHASPRGTHPVRVTPGSRLACLLGTENAEVNSRHHQAIKTLGEGLIATAWAPDGVIEGVELPGQWVAGVQWHPEDMIDDSETARRLFAALVEATT
jgi:gamma-glutamyl-gamma-aminobutyrate hydrolase PuuD